MKIAVLSDTHGLLRREVKEIIESSDAVIHGGDINSQAVLDEIRSIAGRSKPLFVVRGNNDSEWAENRGDEGRAIFVTFVIDALTKIC